MIRRPPRTTLSSSSAASDVYKRQDLFSHTHTEEHFESARWILDTLDKAGYIEPRVSEEPYDPIAKQFLPDRYVEGTCRDRNDECVRGEQFDDCGKNLDSKEVKNPRPKLNPDAKSEFRET